jgi:hypothetical protein
MFAAASAKICGSFQGSDGCGNESRIVFRTYLSCEAPKDEQSACNRNHVFGNRHGEVSHMNSGNH